MSKKVIIGFLLPIFFSVSIILGMKEESVSKKRKRKTGVTSESKRIKKTPFKFLNMTNTWIVPVQFYYNGKPVVRKKDETENEYIYGELVDMSQQDPILKDSFGQLMQEKYKEGLPYILAVLTVQIGPNKYARYYQDAVSLVKWMYNEDFTVKGLDKMKHLLTQQPILEPIYFFVWYPNEKNFEFLGHSKQLLGRTEGYHRTYDQFLEKMLLVNADMSKSNDAIILAQYFSAKDKINLVEKYLKKELEVNPNNTFALTSLGELYLESQNYNLAEEYFKKGANLGNEYAMLSVIYLFGIGKISQILPGKLKEYYNFALKNKEESDQYKAMTDRWKVIEGVMQSINKI